MHTRSKSMTEGWLQKWHSLKGSKSALNLASLSLTEAAPVVDWVECVACITPTQDSTSGPSKGPVVVPLRGQPRPAKLSEGRLCVT